MDDLTMLDAHAGDPASLAARIAEEFRVGFELLAQLDRPAVTIFGSARIHEPHPLYDLARAMGREFAHRGWAVITGGGPGLMEAANRGAQEAGGLSVGFGIELPHPQGMNDYLDIAHTFEHFYVRKVCFVKPAEGFAALPGGFGTLDELFELLTLTQTGKTRLDPVVLFGSDHWSGLTDWIDGRLLGNGLISPADRALFRVTDDVTEAADTVVGAYQRRC